MKDFTYYNDTKVIFGRDIIETLRDNVKIYSDRVLLVYGKGSIKKTGLYHRAIELLSDRGVTITELGGVDPNPRVESVVEGAKLCRENNIGFILAIGGGSVIDCAKGIAMATFYNGDPWDFYSYKVEPKKALPLGSILTLAATGSEMNNGTVISNRESEEKNGFGHPLLQPKFAILDPTLTYTVPSKQTAAGVIDIIAHCFEFYFSRVDSAYLQNRMMEAIMKTCIHYGPIAIEDPNNYEARANLMWASSMALNGITCSGTVFDGTNHLLEHVVSGFYDLTHGVGLGIIMPHWLEEILDKDTEYKISEYARNVWSVKLENNREAALEGIKKTREFILSLGLPVKFSEVGIPRDRFDEMVNKTLYKETLGEFKPLDFEGLMNILKKAE